MKYNIIGDIHGRTGWKDLVREDCINIFVGDYFSPYEPIKFEDQQNNFMDIIMYKVNHPETVLLIGNHDEDHWHIHEHYSRYDAFHFIDIKTLFEENKDFFQIAYSIENKALVTHAGVSLIWYDRKANKNLFGRIYDFNYDTDDMIESPYTHEMVPVTPQFKPSLSKTALDAYNLYIDTYNKHWANDNKSPKPGTFVVWHDTMWQYCEDSREFEKFEVTPDEIAAYVNNLWLSGKYSAFNFENNAGPNDYYGDDERHGPLWIRPEALLSSNIFLYTNYLQFVGHTQFKHPTYQDDVHANGGFITSNGVTLTGNNNIVWLDCLGSNIESIIYDSTSGNTYLNEKLISK